MSVPQSIKTKLAELMLPLFISLRLRWNRLETLSRLAFGGSPIIYQAVYKTQTLATQDILCIIDADED